MMHRLAILSTHPIQYNAPLFRMLHEEEDLELVVFFSKTWDQVKYDPDFQREVVWDLPVAEGYPHSTYDASTTKGKHQLAMAIAKFEPNAILVYGWNFPGHLSIMRSFHGVIPIWFRGDSHLLNPMPFWKKLLRRIALYRVYKNVDIAFSVGQANENYYLWSGMEPGQLVRAPHSVDIEYWESKTESRQSDAENWRRKLDIPDNAYVVGFAGKIEAIKQVDLIIKSTLDSGKTQHAVIAGSGPLLASLTLKYSNNPQVHFLGFINQRQMPVFYRMIDVLALASSSETWGLCVNEAMACGTPCIVSDRAGCSLDMFDDIQHGQVAPWNNQSLWTEAIQSQMNRVHPTANWDHYKSNFHPRRFLEAIQWQLKSSVT